MAKIACSEIKYKTQLTEENLNLIFQSYYEDAALKVELLDNDNEKQEVGEHYQSDISKLSVKINANPIG